MKAVLVALSLLLVPAALAADYRNPTAGKAVALQLPGMHLAKVQRNLVYKSGLRLDVYRPQSSTRRLPAVLFVHGLDRPGEPEGLGPVRRLGPARGRLRPRRGDVQSPR